MSEPEIIPRGQDSGEVYHSYGLPMDTLIKHERPHALIEDVGTPADVIHYDPLQQLPDGSWLISVRGRVYELREETLEAGIRTLQSNHE